jgi:3-isopropylmalate/(R)-2-methylmalate dehydratase large subunit
MEARMTICNMSIEMGARGGLIAPDEVTYSYLRRTRYFIENPEALKKFISADLKSDRGAVFEKEISIDAESIKPMITYGTNPGMAAAVDEFIPEDNNDPSFIKSLNYMGFKPGRKLAGQKIDYVFLGSCTNGRIEDFRAFASLVKGRKKAKGVTALLVPGSKLVEEQIVKEGLHEILNEAGFKLRQPGCSSCLAMNEDRIPSGKYAVSTSNRNFEGRQGPGSRTLLASPLTAAAAAITGKITDPRELI